MSKNPIREYGALRFAVEDTVKIDDIKKSSRIGLGMEKLDRKRFNPENVYGWVEKSGARWIRIQSGWAMTEQKPGEYDFLWLDKIVENILKIGCIPWLCLCYGNDLYTEKNIENPDGAFGMPPIHNDIQKQAWNNYIKALAEHYKGKIVYYEVWNEPDGPWCWPHGVSGYEYGEFARDTAKILKDVNSEAKLVAGSFCLRYTLWLEHAFRAGMAPYIDYISYHSYGYDIDIGVEKLVGDIRNVINKFRKEIKIIQGEVGCQSRMDGLGAVSDGQWNETIQAKQLLRRLIIDLSTEVEFTSWFSTVDMIENAIDYDPNCPEKNYGFFGVLREELKKGFPTSVYSPKPSYYALQRICKLFPDDSQITNLSLQYETDIQVSTQERRLAPSDEVKTVSFKRKNGYCFAYWKSTDARRIDYHGYIRIYISGIKGKLKLVDSLSGEIMDISEECHKKEIIRDVSTFHIALSKKDAEYGDSIIDLPLCDYPMILTIGDYLD